MRRTIARSVTVDGVGLHLGVPCALECHPASSGSGIRFIRRDLSNAVPIPATVDQAVLSERRTPSTTAKCSAKVPGPLRK